MNWISLYLGAGAILLGCLFLLWLFSLWRKDASIIDIFWGVGFVIVAWWYGWGGQGLWARKALVIGLVSVWGIRLSLHILVRNWGKPEDYRYHQWRQEAGNSWWWRSFFKVFLLQGIILWLLSTPLFIAQFQATPNTLTALDILGALVWLFGFVFESIGDYQLVSFKRDPDNRGKLLTTGLWKYTRHPNYFGDATLWWGYFLIALLAPWGIYTIYAPILMTFLLLKVSGVAMLERGLQRTKPGYEEYTAKTNAFIPWFPKK